jgi:hypothetical protein
MSAGVFTEEPTMGAHALDARARGRGPVHRGRSISARESALIREMLSTLETLTVAGQRHSMGKIAGFLSETVERPGPTVSLRTRSAARALLSRLAHESERLSPDVAGFCWAAESLLRLLSESI